MGVNKFYRVRTVMFRRGVANCYVGGATSRIYDGRAAPEAYRTDLSQGAAALKVYIIELIWRDMRLKV